MPTAWPDRNQKAPNYWDLQLKAWIEEAPTVAGAFRNALDARIQSVAPATDISGKADLVSGKVPASQLPSYVDDVLEFANLAAFPATGETGKIYTALDTNLLYRWSGSAYVNITAAGLALGETSSTAYRGDRGKTAYDHSQVTGNPHSTTLDQVLGSTSTTFGRSLLLMASLGLLLRKSTWTGAAYLPARPADGLVGWEFISTNDVAATAPPSTNLVNGDIWTAHPDAVVS